MTNEVFIVAAVRTPVGKAGRGALARTRPDDLLVHVLKAVLERCPGLDPGDVEDVIIGCAMPEAEQGLNVARSSLLLAGLPDRVPGMTINRFCSSGLQTVATAADRIRLGNADVMIAGGTESMSMVPMIGNKPRFNPSVFRDNEHIAIAFGMGVTAERVAQQWQVGREAQDQFALESHRRAIAAIDSGEFNDEIVPLTVRHRVPASDGRTVIVRELEVSVDEGPRRDTSLEALAALKPVFAVNGSVTAGNSSQMSDGAGAVVLMSKKALQRYGLEPLARFCGFAVVGVPADIMGIGPKEAVPRVLKQVGVKQSEVDWIELNEAFAAQSLAVINDLKLDPARVNPLGGAIALGHPLGATGAIRTATLVHGLRRKKLRYGMVTMCVGTGMGAAGLFEAL
jgi:acetyl-CoA acyltransferase